MDVKSNKKAVLISIKYGTWVIGFMYFIQMMLGCFGIQSVLISFLSYTPIIPLAILIAFSIFLGFCIWHRMPLYYALTLNIINMYDCYIGIPIANKWMLIIYLLLIGLFILIGCFTKNKKNVRKRNFTEGSA